MGNIRISDTQGAVLYSLSLFEQVNNFEPVPAVLLYKMASTQRTKVGDICKKNFRTGCHTLVKHGFLKLTRYDISKLSFQLTETGRVKAVKIAEEKQRELEAELAKG